MSAYAPADDARPLTSADITTLFRKPAGWFDRDRVRKRFYARGFPHPIDRGLWSSLAVRNWMTGAGHNPEHVQPSAPRKRTVRRHRASGYAAASR